MLPRGEHHWLNECPRGWLRAGWTTPKVGWRRTSTDDWMCSPEGSGSARGKGHCASCVLFLPFAARYARLVAQRPPVAFPNAVRADSTSASSTQ